MNVSTARRSEVIYAGLVVFAVVLLPSLLYYSPQLTEASDARVFTVIGHSHQSVQESVPESGYWMVSEERVWRFWKAGTPSRATGQNEIRVKKGEVVKLKITSFDVVHDFALPAYGIIERIYPGKVTVVTFRADEPGEYPFFCTASCGFPSHVWMRGKLVVE